MLENYILLYLWQSFTTFLNMFFLVSGSGIINPISAVLTDPHRAIGIGYTIFLLGSIQRVYLFRKDIFEEKQNKHYLKIMIPASVLGAIVGGLFLSKLHMKLMTALIIVSSLFFIYKTIQSLVTGDKKEARGEVRYSALGVAVFTGFLQGASLPGADLRNNFLRSHISEVSVRALGSTIGLCNFLTVSLILLFSSKLLRSDLLFILSFIPALFIIQAWGKKILVKIKDRQAKILALSMSIISLAVLISSFVQGLS